MILKYAKHMIVLAVIITAFFYIMPKFNIGEVTPVSGTAAISSCEGMKSEHFRYDINSGGHNCAVVTCAQCHVGGFYAGSAPNTCIGCHMGGRPTATQKNSTHIKTDAIGCENCHKVSNVSFSSATMNHNVVTTYACSSCHGVSPSAIGKPNDHVKTTLECSTCHKSTKSWDAKFDHVVAQVAPTTCNTCHLTGSSGATKMPSNHIPTTESCDSCHSGYSTFNNGTLNHDGVTATALQCEACHTGNKLGATMKGAQHIANIKNCASCHNPSTWNCMSGDNKWFIKLYDTATGEKNSCVG